MLVLGAETEVGQAIASALAEAGADLGLVAALNEPQAAFAVQRLARRFSSGGHNAIAQAIDATNEMAVRVMVRQVSKGLGGLDAVVFAVDLGDSTEQAAWLAIRYSRKEAVRQGGGVGFFPYNREELPVDFIERLLHNLDTMSATE